MKVAFATEDGVTVNCHFGHAQSFDIYEIGTEGSRFLERRMIEDGEEEVQRIDGRIEAIRDCAILYVNAIGAAAAARVTRARIHPVKVREGEPLVSILADMHRVLTHNPPPWLRKILMSEAGAANSSGP
ncbi:nitrogen fixation protein NifX [Kyrpidia spormannii]|uniref:Nitrogen fixation protein NifX n=1 Tax=Kyrpidia spormannii TaxID=2055160 RepID=A0A2K8NAY8_9BACL|nr:MULTISPECIES: nitrogen fixation protein NifX [Kyrpidia]ATY86496.1 nitrogen fixation protein NifX [Kyrpidia spormannii]MCL6574618.1 nitrogen fixation protein NifX [Kyrpidia sp.]